MQVFSPADFRTGSPQGAGRLARISWRWWEKLDQGRSTLLIAPTGAGKTLAGFLPSLVELEARGKEEAGFRRIEGRAHALYLAAEGTCR